MNPTDLTHLHHGQCEAPHLHLPLSVLLYDEAHFVWCFHTQSSRSVRKKEEFVRNYQPLHQGTPTFAIRNKNPINLNQVLVLSDHHHHHHQASERIK